MAEIVKKVYELQDIGKGVITVISADNLLKLSDIDLNKQGLEEVIVYDNTLSGLRNIDLEQGAGILAGSPVSSELSGYFEVSNLGYLGLNLILSSFGKSDSINFGGLRVYGDKMLIEDGFYNKGLENSGDYEANFTDRSLITKQFFDDNVPVIDGSETKINSGITTVVSGNGTIATPYIIETVNLQKSITGNYTLTSADNNYSIKVDNGSTPITITVPIGLPLNFFAGITQKGTADVTFVGSGTTITNPIGLKIKGQGYYVGVEQIGSTNNFDLLGNTKS